MSFNGKRFVQTVKWTEATYLTPSIKQMVIMAVMLFVATMMAHNGTWTSESIHAVTGTAIAVLTLYFIFCGTQITLGMRKQQSRVFAMMLPASNGEKYLARLLHVTLGAIAITVVATVGADVLSMVYRMVTTGQLPASLTWATLTDTVELLEWTSGNAAELFATTTSVLMVVLAHSFFVLGGTFFRRAQLPLTMLVGFCIMLFLGFSTVKVASGDLPAELELDTEYVIDLYSVYVITDVVIVLFALLSYWLAYRLFKRMQLINNKWINV